MPATLSTPAPSAAPAAVAPASLATPAAPASTAAATAPATLNDFAELARLSITGEQATPAAELPATGNEPSPEPAAEPAEPTPEATAETPEGEEPAAEDTANWTDGEKKLHGALVKERAERKEARNEVRELKAKLAELESKLTAPPGQQAEPAAPVATAPAVPSTADVLADCQTFEAVDAKAVQAAATESQAIRLQNMLNRNGVEAVAERLKASGVEAINGTPVDEASADVIGEFLASVYEGARVAQAQAPQRKQWIANNQQSLAQAVQILPELNDAQSPAYKAAVALVQQNPQLRQRADWPVVVAKLYLGEQAFNAKLKPAAAAVAAPKPALKPAAKSAPSAPRTSTAAMPQASAHDALAAKIAKGTATLLEVQEYALAGVRA